MIRLLHGSVLASFGNFGIRCRRTKSMFGNMPAGELISSVGRFASGLLMRILAAMSAKRLAQVLLFLLLGATSNLLAQRVTNAKCGFSLSVPPHWKITRTPNRDVPCWYTVESPRKKEACSFLVRTVDADFEVAANNAGFERREGKWIMPPSYPLGETIDAEEISGEHWRGVKAEHVERATQVGRPVDTSEVWIAVLNNGEKRSAVIEGFDCPDSRLGKLVQSFRFIPKTK
jgi:hypothetical protein